MRKSGLFLLLLVAVFMFYGLYVLKSNKTYIGAAFIVEGLKMANEVKQQVTEFYQVKGQLPSSNTELGLDDPHEYQSKAVTSLEITESGSIVVTYNEKSGIDGGEVHFIPSENKSPTGLGWQCVTPSFKEMEKWAPQCKYEEPMLDNLDGEEILEFIDKLKN